MPPFLFAGGRPRAPVPFFAPPKKGTKERGIPGSPRKIGDRPDVWVCPRFFFPCAARPARRSAQLAHRLDSFRLIGREFPAIQRVYARLAQCSTETPGRSALLGGSQGPQDRLLATGCWDIKPPRCSGRPRRNGLTSALKGARLIERPFERVVSRYFPAARSDSRTPFFPSSSLTSCSLVRA